jgi:hypothetical protein
MPWFSVVQLDGAPLTAKDLEASAPTVIAFLCAHSPYVRSIEQHLGASLSQRMEQGVNVVAIASNDPEAYPTDAADRLTEQGRAADFRFPYCLDLSQRAAKAFQATCTPEFFVFDRDFRLTYHGQYDDTRPGDGRRPTGVDLLDAIDAVVDQTILQSDQQPSFGCSIKWRAGAEPSYVLAP